MCLQCEEILASIQNAPAYQTNLSRSSASYLNSNFILPLKTMPKMITSLKNILNLFNPTPFLCTLVLQIFKIMNLENTRLFVMIASPTCLNWQRIYSTWILMMRNIRSSLNGRRSHWLRLEKKHLNVQHYGGPAEYVSTLQGLILKTPSIVWFNWWTVFKIIHVNWRLWAWRSRFLTDDSTNRMASQFLINK